MSKNHHKKLHDKFKQNINNFASQKNHHVFDQKLNNWWFSSMVWLVMLKTLYNSMNSQIQEAEEKFKSNNNSSSTDLLELSKSLIMNLYAYREKLYRLLYCFCIMDIKNNNGTEKDTKNIRKDDILAKIKEMKKDNEDSFPEDIFIFCSNKINKGNHHFGKLKNMRDSIVHRCDLYFEEVPIVMYDYGNGLEWWKSYPSKYSKSEVKKTIIGCFEAYKENSVDWIEQQLIVFTEDNPEIIINRLNNFDIKRYFYMK